MKIYTPKQTQKLDAYTIKEQEITSWQLMERASMTFVNWLLETDAVTPDTHIHVLCGTGNNGGDGMAIARILHTLNFEVSVYLLRVSDNKSEDFKTNYEAVKAIPLEVKGVEMFEDLEGVYPEDFVIDAVLGAGLNRPLAQKWCNILDYISFEAPNVSIDIPSGLFVDKATMNPGFKADKTYSFHSPKLAFFMPENQDEVGEWVIGDIKLEEEDVEFDTAFQTNNHYLNGDNVRFLLQDRKPHDHKGTFGHALMIAGSYGKVGAAVLAAKATLRAGAGLVTVHAPKCAYQILQISFPEAMVEVDKHETVFTECEDLSKYEAIGIGPGLGTNELTVKALSDLLENAKQPLVIDADALNIISQNKEMLDLIPEDSILTPHPKEFERLFGETKDSFERLEIMRSIAQSYKIFIILKGGNTVIMTPEGIAYFNGTGNPGMATGGSGDVLTGVLTGLVASGYSPLEACAVGVYLHGLAGDIAAEEMEQESLLASDIVKCLGKAFRELRVS
jgi:NAD(P)H-hydrate epimerase